MKHNRILKTALYSTIFLLPAVLYSQELATAGVHLASSTDKLTSFLPQGVKLTAVTMGIGGLTGWAVGFTLKKFAKLAALIVGISFITIQYLAFHKFITVDWDKIKAAVPNEQIQKTWLDAMSMLTLNLPFAGSFLAGFWLGFRKG